MNLNSLTQQALNYYKQTVAAAHEVRKFPPGDMPNLKVMALQQLTTAREELIRELMTIDRTPDQLRELLISLEK